MNHLKMYTMDLALCLTSTIPAFAVEMDETAGLPRISLTPSEAGGQILKLELQETAQRHWRLDTSQDLTNWTRLSATTTLDGSGSFSLSDLQSVPGMNFFRAALDSSVTNVLNLPQSPTNYSEVDWPAHLAAELGGVEDNTPSDNPVTDAGATLGRVLFYDVKLSRNHSISCSSCHLQKSGFSDDPALSEGFDGGLTGRNSMGLANSLFYRREHFFWDERADTLEDQTLMPIQDPVEMGMTLEDLVERLSQYDYYKTLFTNAFGDEEITSNRISRALAQFVRSIVSYRTKFDEVVASDFSNFTAQERAGRNLFNGRGRCNDCHQGPNFVGQNIDNNGLEFPFVDLGVGGVTGDARDEGKFKMSSLRNIELTAPYMHDGRFQTLEEVIDHYSNGVVDNPNLGGELRVNGGPGGPGGPGGAGNGEVARPNFTAAERAALVAFLKTLTDYELMEDERFSDPFQR